MCANHVREVETHQKYADEVIISSEQPNELQELNAEQGKAGSQRQASNINGSFAICLERGEIIRNNSIVNPSKPGSRLQRRLKLIFGWTAGALMLLFLAFITFGILYSGIHYHGNGLHDLPSNNSTCVVPFSGILGVSNGVFAYSNCNEDYTSDEWSFTPFNKNNQTGMKWQCVEYARRYLMLHGVPERATFENVVGAADIWLLNSVQLFNGSTTPLLKYANGASIRSGGSKPRVGDLLIYPRQPGGFPFGHVAVIVGVTDNSIFVAEQNWGNDVWPGPYHNYSREISMLYDSSEHTYTLKEEDNITIQGWVRYGA